MCAEDMINRIDRVKKFPFILGLALESKTSISPYLRFIN